MVDILWWVAPSISTTNRDRLGLKCSHQPAMAGFEGTLKLLQAFVVDQWKSGGGAELRVFCEGGHLKVSVSADFGPCNGSWKADSASLGAGGSPHYQFW